MYQRILVPTDGSDITSKSVASALDLAKSLGASVIALSVKEPFPYSAISEMQPTPPQEFFEAQQRIADTRVGSVATQAAAKGVPCSTHAVEALHPWEAIIEFAEQNRCDLIVMASHGRSGVAALLLGSTTQKVLTHTKVPVLVVR